MKHTLALLTDLLLAPLAALHAADAPNQRPLLGVVRWDMYTGHGFTTQKHSEGGFLCPTMGEAPDYRPVTRRIDEVAAGAP